MGVAAIEASVVATLPVVAPGAPFTEAASAASEAIGVTSS